MGVSKNRGTPKSSILIGFSIINHPFWGTPIFGNIHIFSDFGSSEIEEGSIKALFRMEGWKSVDEQLDDLPKYCREIPTK